MLSLDTELAWGVVDKPSVLKENRIYYEKVRHVIDRMLSLMEKYNISATWAVVGHLFIDKCELTNGIKHADIPRSNYPWYEKDWFDECPCSGIENAPLWYGKDIVNKIMNCKIRQEIGSHSFSHIIFGDKNTRRETVTADIQNCINEAKSMGITLESFVFPRNSVGYLDEIKKAGFKVFRGAEPSWYSNFPSSIKKICHIADQLIAVVPPVNTPVLEEGMINIPASMLYLPMNGFRKYIPLSCRVLKANRGIKRAIENKKIFHLWFHPFNISTNQEKLLYGLERIFKKVDEERSKGTIDIKTMNELASSINYAEGNGVFGV